jgi:hypothetical protein
LFDSIRQPQTFGDPSRLAVALTAACLWFFLRDNQVPVFEVIAGSIHRVD